MGEWRLQGQALDMECRVNGFSAYFRGCAGSRQQLVNSSLELCSV